MKEKEQHINESELLRRYKSDKDSYWLGLIFESYTTLLLGVAFKYLKDKDQAQDIVQQAFVKAILELERNEIHNIGAWLYQVTRNESLNYLKKQQHYEVDITETNIAEESPISMHAFMLEEEKRKELLQAIEQLKGEQKECIELFYFKKQSYQNIAETLNISLKQVKSSIQNGKRNLKNILEASNPQLFKS